MAERGLLTLASDTDDEPASVDLYPETPTLSSRVSTQLAHQALDPEYRLKVILDMVQRSYEEYQEACMLADAFGMGDMPDGTDNNDLAAKREDMRANVRRCYNRWHELTEQARRAESELRKRVLEKPLTGEWRQTFEHLRTELRAEYSGLGPHYDLLCDNTAAVAIRMRQMEESGRDYESSEYVELTKLYLSLTNQLQKYTEAMKSESINKQTQETAMRLMQIAERHFAATYPVQWQQFISDIRAALEDA